jgi:peroxiredoxin-like protein
MEASPFTFPVALEWAGGKRVRAHVEGKQTIEIATPPEFGSGIEGVWSPEDFLVAAAASCFAVTLIAISERSRVPLLGLAVDGVGVVGSSDGKNRDFSEIVLPVVIETDGKHVEAARKAAERAERYCLVGNALSIPVRLELTVLAVEPERPSVRTAPVHA